MARLAPPPDAVCVEDGCDYPATTTRPGTEPWLYDGGVITEYDVWVCAIHGWSEIGYTTDAGVGWLTKNPDHDA